MRIKGKQENTRKTSKYKSNKMYYQKAARSSLSTINKLMIIITPMIRIMKMVLKISLFDILMQMVLIMMGKNNHVYNERYYILCKVWIKKGLKSKLSILLYCLVTL